MKDIDIVTFRSIYIIILIFYWTNAHGQISPEKSAQSKMARGKWAKAAQTLKKSLAKDSINAEANFVYSQWWFSPINPDFDIDKSYEYILYSQRDYAAYDERQRDRVSRFPLDSLIINKQKRKIDSAAFERAKQMNTEESYQFFLDHFGDANERSMATELRDEVSFLNAMKVNTYESFDHYLSKYPDSHRAAEAKGRYEKLLFESKTRGGKLKSYVFFYETYPHSPFRDEALKEIFQIGTASGSLNDYLNFIDTYGHQTSFSKTAKDIAYHLAVHEQIPIPYQVASDSIQRVSGLDKGYWVPFLKNGKYGFMDEDGVEQIKERFESISDEYLCGNIIDDFIVTSTGIVGRSGKRIYEGEVEEVIDLGRGVLLLKSNQCNHVINKSGFVYTDGCILDARLIADHFLAVQQTNAQWELLALNGRKIINEYFDNIESVEDIVILVRRGKKILHTVAQITSAADQEPLSDDMVFDEVRKLSTDKVLVKNGSLEGVVNAQLEFIIPLDRQSLTMTSFGFTKRYLNKVSTVGLSQTIDREEYSDIRPYLNWLGFFRQDEIKLYQISSSRVVDDNLDSLWFSNRLALALKHDSLMVFFSSGRKMVFPSGTQVSFVKSPDSVKFFAIEDMGKKQVFDVDTGLKRFSLTCNRIEDIGYNIFLIEVDGKAGLVTWDGKVILQTEYDAIVKSSEQFISLLKNKKFGIYDLKNRLLVKPNYERNVRFYNQSVLVAFKDGHYGFIGMDGKPIGDFEFEEVSHWSDSLALVRKNFRWSVYSIHEREIVYDRIKDYRLIADLPAEKIAIIHRENEYGVLSSKRGVVIPATFSDVLNVGTAEKPLYFTEKNVEEAEIFVVIYYNDQGTMIRREIYESDEYDRIYCR